MIRDTPNFKYVQDLACPRCGAMVNKIYYQDQHGRYKQLHPQLRRAESKGRWAADDVLEDVIERTGKYESKKVGRQWVHTADLECSRCGCHMSRAQCVKKSFADDELPYDFWEMPYGEYVSDEPTAPVIEDSDPDPADLYDLPSLF